MVPVYFLFVSAMIVASPASGGLIESEVSTTHVDMDWTEIVPGIEILVQGVFHSTTSLFATGDPLVYRLVGLTLFHGTIGVRGFDPVFGFVSIVIDAKVSETRAVGTFTLDPTGFPIPIDMVLSVRSVGTLTATVGTETIVEEVNGLLMGQIRNGEPLWIRIGVPMGWPFQIPLP